MEHHRHRHGGRSQNRHSNSVTSYLKTSLAGTEILRLKKFQTQTQTAVFKISGPVSSRQCSSYHGVDMMFSVDLSPTASPVHCIGIVQDETAPQRVLFCAVNSFSCQLPRDPTVETLIISCVSSLYLFITRESTIYLPRCLPR
jgi:hypothetical protein